MRDQEVTALRNETHELVLKKHNNEKTEKLASTLRGLASTYAESLAWAKVGIELVYEDGQLMFVQFVPAQTEKFKKIAMTGCNTACAGPKRPRPGLVAMSA